MVELSDISAVETVGIVRGLAWVGDVERDAIGNSSQVGSREMNSLP